MKSLLLLIGLFACSFTLAQSVVGKWKTIDDETGEVKSIVNIYEQDGKIYGDILELINPEKENPICDLCKDDRLNQEVIGMQIIRDMILDGEEYEDGTICDPKNGKIYNCKLWIKKDEPNVLNVRGYIYFFYRTQTWIRFE